MLLAIFLALTLSAGDTWAEPPIVAHVRAYAASTEPTVLERDVLEMARAYAIEAHLDPAATERAILAAVLAIKAGGQPDPAVTPLLEKVMRSAQGPKN
jgi:hypothetical protein